MRRYIFLLIALGMLCWGPPAGADEVGLNNGNIIEGVITQETDEIVELEVFIYGKIVFNIKEDIAYLKKWSKEENQALKKKWLKEKEERQRTEHLRQQFEAWQRANGLVNYRGQWISDSEKERLKSREYVDDVLRERVAQGKIAQSGRERSDLARSVLLKGDWQYRQTQHFIVYYEDVMQSKAVADKAEYFYEKIAFDLDYGDKINWPDKCEVFIIPDEEKWREYVQEFVAGYDHIGGFVPQTGVKEIYLCALSLSHLSVSFPHELAHLIFAEFAQGKPLPLWLNEGLAIYESGLIGYADEMLRDKVKEAEHIPLKEMVEMKDYPRSKEQMELFYAQAEKTVEFLITQHGRKKFSRFCQLLISGKTFARVLDSVYGNKYRSQDKFSRAWIKYVLK